MDLFYNKIIKNIKYIKLFILTIIIIVIIYIIFILIIGKSDTKNIKGSISESKQETNDDIDLIGIAINQYEKRHLQVFNTKPSLKDNNQFKSLIESSLNIYNHNNISQSIKSHLILIKIKIMILKKQKKPKKIKELEKEIITIINSNTHLLK